MYLHALQLKIKCLFDDMALKILSSNLLSVVYL